MSVSTEVEEEMELQVVTETEMQRVSATSLILDDARLNQAFRMSEIMATAGVTVPDHLRGKQGDCMAIVLQSMQWGMNPFVVAQKTHIVNGKLGYEAQLVNAVVQSQRFIVGSFEYQYQGEGEGLSCRVGAILKGETEKTYNEWLEMSLITTRNSPLWKTNPKQQMGYLQVKNWVRSFAPGAILGVYTTEELEAPVIKQVNKVAAIEPAAEPKPEYISDDDFDADSDQWEATFLSGHKSGKTVDMFIGWLEAKGKLATDEQKATIKSWEPIAPDLNQDQPEATEGEE